MQALELVKMKQPEADGSIIDRYLAEFEAIDGQLSSAGDDLEPRGPGMTVAFRSHREVARAIPSRASRFVEPPLDPGVNRHESHVSASR